VLKKILRRINRIEGKLYPEYKNEFKKVSFSQCGEDILVDYVFNLRGIFQPSYIDIGAHHPYYLSNTALFYERGCRGINIEANPGLLSEFTKHRPNDINLNLGIYDKETEMDFYIMMDNTLSTFSKQEYDFMIANGKLLDKTQKIKLAPLSSILEQYFKGEFPNFMTIDVEGLDFAILQSIDFEKSSPTVICVEAAEYSPVGAGARRSELIDFLISKNYFEYANTNLNAIMVKKEFWYK
jgi:FkbM family methyltransferase